MPLIWRRHHGPHLVAHVVERDPNQFSVAVSQESTCEVQEAPRQFRRVVAAKAAADALLRRTFRHTCSVEECGRWLVWAV
jgi:hypothetical protein